MDGAAPVKVRAANLYTHYGFDCSALGGLPQNATLAPVPQPQ